MTPLVSVIMPSYNAERHIAESIASVQTQTLDDWELIVSDDCSSDSTREIVSGIAESDPRVRLLPLEENGGAAKARNNSLSHARGRYIAYLDADDLWYPEKLERQIAFMGERCAAFSCASYEVVGEDGAPLGRTVHMLDTCDYMGFLTHNLLQTVGIMADTERLDRSLLVMPPMQRRQDAATWLQVLKAGHACRGLPDVLCAYRRVAGSLSSDKFKAARGVWSLYRDVERLPLPMSLYCFVRYAALAVWKRSYTEGTKERNERSGR
ncbi:glycosyltransferase family 2 protein [Collinsella ihumii]|uniref:glycosyltransferase family 2 protein n=1 Tax=Collinsella ihumii TaxID=1720204 RepID=UPI0025AA8EC8|nr:glycosyltransferase family 2 protein [Collinsella ihumii]MDN0055087.1 glycosyltransferase family 2 protein [Collinsella ihumii]